MSDDPNTQYPEDDDLARWLRHDDAPEDLSVTSSGAANRTELLRPASESFDERLERVRSRRMVQPSSQPMLPVVKHRRKRHPAVFPITLLVLAVTCGLVVLALLLPPFSDDSPLVDALQIDDGILTGDKTRVEKDGFAVEVHPGDPGEDFSVIITRVTGENALENCPSVEALPAYVSGMGDRFSITSSGTPPARVGLHVPLNQAQSADLYGWYADEKTWDFIPAQPAAAENSLVTDIPLLPDCVVTVQVADSAPELTLNLNLGQTRSEAITPNRLFIGGMQPTIQGNLQGVLPADTPAEAEYPVIPLISNFTTPEVIDTATVEAILRNQEMRLQHAGSIAGFVEVNNYPGVALDYRGISPELRNQFSDLVKNVARVLESQNRILIVLVPPATFDHGWQTGAYDWRTLGLLADEIIIRLPHEPETFLPNGDVDAMLQWVVGEVSRTKLSISLSALSVETAPGSSSRQVAFEQAWEGLGEITFDSGTESVIPGNPVSAYLNTPYQVKIGLDETIQSPYVTYSDERGNTVRTFWLMTASALYYRIQKAEAFNLKGVLVTDMYSPGVDAAIVDTLVAYQGDTAPETDVEPFSLHLTIYDSSETIILEQNILPGEPVNFTPPENETRLKFELSVDGYIETVDVPVATSESQQ